MKIDHRLITVLLGITLAVQSLGVCSQQRTGDTAAASGRTADVVPAPDKSIYTGAAGRKRDTPETTASAAGTAGSADGSVSAAARSFMAKAAQDGMTEVEAGKIAAHKAQSADVRQFAQEMVKDHSQANDELMRVAQQKGVQLPTTLDPKHQAKLEKLRSLSGADFDRTYSKEMNQAHQQAVSLFQQAAQGVPDPDVKSFAAKTLPTLRGHLKMAQSLQGASRG
jgi:putative membrane protein